MVKTVLQRLKNCEAGNKFKREAMKVMMRNLGISELQDLTEVFRDLDRDHTGILAPKSYKKGSVELCGSVIEQIIQKVDLAGNGKINYSEFLSCTIDQKRLLSAEARWSAFKLL